jgi:hypothetical protein
MSNDQTTGPAVAELSTEDLLREMTHLHATRTDTLRHGSQSALQSHTHRMSALEQEYLRRFPDREVDPERLREGARDR